MRVVMLLENNPYPADVRVRNEAESLVAAGHRVVVVAPRGPGERRREAVRGVEVERYWLPATPDSPVGFVVEYVVAQMQLLFRGWYQLLRGAEVEAWTRREQDRVQPLHSPQDMMLGQVLLDP